MLEPDDLTPVPFVIMGDALAHDAFASRVVPLLHADIQKEQEKYDFLEQETINAFVENIINGQVNRKRNIDDGLDKQYHSILSEEKITYEQTENYKEIIPVIAVAKTQSPPLPEPQAAGDHQKLAAEIEQLSKEKKLLLQVVEDYQQRLREHNMLCSSKVDENGKVHTWVTKSTQNNISFHGGNHEVHFHVNDNTSINNEEETENTMRDQYNFKGDIKAEDHSQIVIGPGTKIQVRSPSSVDEKLFSETLKVLNSFSESKEAEKSAYGEIRALQEMIIELQAIVGQMNRQTLTERLRGFLAFVADLVTIGTPLYTYINAHPEIDQSIRDMFIQ